MANVSSLIQQRLAPSELAVLKAAAAAAGLGVQLYLVGGTARDILSGAVPADLDLVSVGMGDDFAADLAARLGVEVIARSRFGTAKLAVAGHNIDLAAARNESYARPGALPDVRPGTIDEDLGRRDFSINAMAISLAETGFGELIDPLGGRSDLDHGVVRVLHAESFVDDATRMFRAVRYAIRLGFDLDAGTERLLERDMGYLDTISGDRVWSELEQVFAEARAAEVLGSAQRHGLLAAVHPPLAVDEEALGRLADRPVDSGRRDHLELLALLVYSTTTRDLPGVTGRLGLNGRRARVARDTMAVRDRSGRLGEYGVRPSEVFDLLHDLDVASIQGCAIAAKDPLVRQRLELYLNELRHLGPALDGNDLLGLGVPQGPRVGELLRTLRAARLDSLLSTREDEERLVRSSLDVGRS